MGKNPGGNPCSTEDNDNIAIHLNRILTSPPRQGLEVCSKKMLEEGLGLLDFPIYGRVFWMTMGNVAATLWTILFCHFLQCLFIDGNKKEHATLASNDCYKLFAGGKLF